MEEWGRSGGRGSVSELSVLSVHFFCKPKTVLKIKSINSKEKSLENPRTGAGQSRQKD